MADGNSTPDPVEIGAVFGRWTVTGYAGTNKRRNRCWEVRCECGTERVVPGFALRNGHSKSCGCARSLNLANTKHGAHGSAEYYAWRSAVSRCHNENSHNYRLYGARGITVCERWRESVLNFIEDMGPRPDGFSLDRIDNDRGYEPGNCRWSTTRQQLRNRRVTPFLTVGAEALPLAEWAERTGIHVDTLRKRIDAGWPPDRVVNTPPMRRPRRA